MIRKTLRPWQPGGPRLDERRHASSVCSQDCEGKAGHPFSPPALPGRLGEEGVPEEMKEVARQTDTFSQLVEEFSATEPASVADVEIAGAPTPAPRAERRPQRARAKKKRAQVVR